MYVSKSQVNRKFDHGRRRSKIFALASPAYLKIAPAGLTSFDLRLFFIELNFLLPNTELPSPEH